MNKGSARNGLAILIKSADPDAKISSAVSGALILLVVQSGILISFFIFAVTHEKPPRGTIVAIVGILASCHPMPAIMMMMLIIIVDIVVVIGIVITAVSI
jgi:hypothetical protein